MIQDAMTDSAGKGPFTHRCIGGSKARVPPRLLNSFIFMQFSAKNLCFRVSHWPLFVLLCIYMVLLIIKAVCKKSGHHLWARKTENDFFKERSRNEIDPNIPSNFGLFSWLNWLRTHFHQNSIFKHKLISVRISVTG